jgi:hypothetical protein
VDEGRLSAVDSADSEGGAVMVAAERTEGRPIDTGRRFEPGPGRRVFATLSSLWLALTVLLAPSGASAGQGENPAAEVLRASTISRVEAAGKNVLLVLEDGTSLEAPAVKFRVTGTAPRGGEQAEPVGPEQRKDPAFREQRRQERAAERAARKRPVTDLQTGQAVLVVARTKEDGQYRRVVVRVFDSLQEAQEVLQERLQKRETRRLAEEQKLQKQQSGENAQAAADAEAGD